MKYTIFVVVVLYSTRDCYGINKQFNNLMDRIEKRINRLDTLCDENEESKACPAISTISAGLYTQLRQVVTFMVDYHTPLDHGSEKLQLVLEALFIKYGLETSSVWKSSDTSDPRDAILQLLKATRKWANSFKKDIQGLDAMLRDTIEWIDDETQGL